MMTNLADSSVDFDELIRNYDLHDPRVNEYHFPLLEYMRSIGPVHRSEKYGGYWVVVGYEEVVAAAKDTGTFSSAEGISDVGIQKTVVFKPIELDPPEHNGWRRVMLPFFSQGAADAVVDPMSKVADELIDRFVGTGGAEVLGDYALPLEHHAFFRQIMGFGDEETRHCVKALDQAQFGETDEARGAGWELVAEFCRDLWDRRAGKGSDGGYVDTIRTATINGESVSKEDFAGWAVMMTAAGAETTPSAIGHLFIHLAENPELRHRLVTDDDLLRSTVAESLRHQSPSNSITRTVTKDVIFGGQQLRKGEKVILMWSSANRDEGLCPHANEFEPARPSTRDVAFGYGAHRCIGERHARALMWVAARSFLKRIPDFDLDPNTIIEYHTGQTRWPVKVPIIFPGNAGLST